MTKKSKQSKTKKSKAPKAASAASKRAGGSASNSVSVGKLPALRKPSATGKAKHFKVFVQAAALKGDASVLVKPAPGVKIEKLHRQLYMSLLRWKKKHKGDPSLRVARTEDGRVAVFRQGTNK